MLSNWVAIFVLIMLFIIFFMDAISSSKYVQDAISEELSNMIEEP